MKRRGIKERRRYKRGKETREERRMKRRGNRREVRMTMILNQITHQAVTTVTYQPITLVIIRVTMTTATGAGSRVRSDFLLK